MPKNVTGGKNFKKGRKVPTDAGAIEKRFDGIEEGQDLARVTKMLGNRRVLCFCGSDGMERVCKIRGVLCKGPKKQRIEIGDIVLVSSRDYSATTIGDDSDDSDTVSKTAKPADGGAVTSNGKRDIYDLITKLSASQIRDARRNVSGMHKHLYEASGSGRVDTTVGFVFGVESDDEEDAAADDSEISHVVDKRDKVNHRRKPAAPLKVEASDDDDGDSSEDIDVDDI